MLDIHSLLIKGMYKVSDFHCINDEIVSNFVEKMFRIYYFITLFQLQLRIYFLAV